MTSPSHGFATSRAAEDDAAFAAMTLDRRRPLDDLVALGALARDQQGSLLDLDGLTLLSPPTWL
jgi:hypothetical protein